MTDSNHQVVSLIDHHEILAFLFLNLMLGISCIVTYALQELQETNSSPLTMNGRNYIFRGELLVFGESILNILMSV